MESAMSLQDLLGSSHSLPVWLNPERFLQPDFDPEVAVLDLRRYVSMAPWRKTLCSPVDRLGYERNIGGPLRRCP